jgi:hypothetical protein
MSKKPATKPVFKKPLRMPEFKDLRYMSKARAEKEAEPVPELPEPLASDPRVGLQRGRDTAALFGENLALYAAAIAFGDGTKSLHTRLQSMQLLWNMIEEVPETVPPSPNGGPRPVING